MRHDLPPNETSQIARQIAGHEAIGDQEVFPTVVVDVRKERPPRPATYAYASRELTSRKVPSPDSRKSVLPAAIRW